MEKPSPKDNTETKSKSLIGKKSIMDWSPDAALTKAIEKSWGLEKLNERSAKPRP
jgi:hypothetical protein